ncbi:MAG: bifunctional alpha/beta hydrolase/OsmC family protein [Marivibrio sp.]|uniref:bifunctional alpha/beta hydrolase/OsmC family protein n=1 Tax=Marivibrio sp. TaxID=2039719 RepID=UPI0032EE6873
MARHSEKVTFTGAQGFELAARLELPEGDEPRAYALFVHGFTLGKDSVAASRIAAALAERGIATLRFDFTGLGGSDGDFANTNFRTNVLDVEAAAHFLAQERRAPAIVIGHSLGGAAVLAAADLLAQTKAIVTIGAPFDPDHVVHNFKEHKDVICEEGEAVVDLGGRPFKIQRHFLDALGEIDLAAKIGGMKKALLVMHSPLDATVGIENAERIYKAARHPKSFVSLDQANHLLTDKRDAAYVAQVLAGWAARYVDHDPMDKPAPTPLPDNLVEVRETRKGPFGNRVRVGRHELGADEPKSMGGRDSGPSPYDYLLASLGACTSMTIRMYADRKGWPLDYAAVRLQHEKVHAEDCADCETEGGKVDVIEREVTLEGELDAAQRAKLLEIADKCPVHRTLHGEIKVRTKLAEG